jgi:hypothetical protein
METPEITMEELRRQLRDLRAQGIDHAYVHPGLYEQYQRYWQNAPINARTTLDRIRHTAEAQETRLERVVIGMLLDLLGLTEFEFSSAILRHYEQNYELKVTLRGQSVLVSYAKRQTSA